MKKISVRIAGTTYELGLNEEYAKEIRAEINGDLGGEACEVKELLGAYIRKTLECVRMSKELKAIHDRLDEKPSDD